MGWAFTGEGQVNFKMVTRDGRPVSFSLSRRDSQDVVDHFRNDAAKNSRFDLFTPSADDCHLIIFNDRSILARIDLNDRSNISVTSHDLKYHIDSLLKFTPPTKVAPELQRIEKIQKIITAFIGKIYQYFMPFLFYFGLLLYIISGIRSILGKPVVLFVIQTSLLLSIVSRLLLLSYIDATSFPAIIINYLSPAYPLLLIFVALAIIDLWDWSEPADQFLTQ